MGSDQSVKGSYLVSGIFSRRRIASKWTRAGSVTGCRISCGGSSGLRMDSCSCRKASTLRSRRKSESSMAMQYAERGSMLERLPGSEGKVFSARRSSSSSRSWSDLRRARRKRMRASSSSFQVMAFSNASIFTL